MKKILKKIKHKKEQKALEALPPSEVPSITNKTVEQHREEVLEEAPLGRHVEQVVVTREQRLLHCGDLAAIERNSQRVRAVLLELCPGLVATAESLAEEIRDVCHSLGVAIAQTTYATDASGEIQALHQLLEAVELEGVLVQADALLANRPFPSTWPSAA